MTALDDGRAAADVTDQDYSFDEDLDRDPDEDAEETWPDDIQPYRDGKIHVLKERCSTCVFRGGNLMHLAPGRMKDLVEENRRQDTAFSCHQTLPYGEYEVDGMAICRGYFDAYGDQVTPLRLAVAMDVIEEVDPPTTKKGEVQRDS